MNSVNVSQTLAMAMVFSLLGVLLVIYLLNTIAFWKIYGKLNLPKYMALSPICNFITSFLTIPNLKVEFFLYLFTSLLVGSMKGFKRIPILFGTNILIYKILIVILSILGLVSYIRIALAFCDKFRLGWVGKILYIIFPLPVLLYIGFRNEENVIYEANLEQPKTDQTNGNSEL